MENVNNDQRKLVYYADFGYLSLYTCNEVIEANKIWQFLCECAVTNDPQACKCLTRKEKRDGTQECFMSTGRLDLEKACELVMEMANKTIEVLKEKAFVCECPALERDSENRIMF